MIFNGIAEITPKPKRYSIVLSGKHEFDSHLTRIAIKIALQIAKPKAMNSITFKISIFFIF
jgi:hypothetical protein